MNKAREKETKKKRIGLGDVGCCRLGATRMTG